MSFLSAFRRPGVDFIVAALGNPGKQYENSRHNAGFLCAAYWMDQLSARPTRARFHALTCEVTVENRRGLIILPQTFMNNSGLAVAEAMRFYRLAPEKLIVLSDDIHLNCGMIRVRAGGSDGGHNGLKSVISHLKSNAFCRVRIGVGEPKSASEQIDWVLSDFSKADQSTLKNEAFPHACDAVELILSGNIGEAMNRYNHKNGINGQSDRGDT